MASYPPNAAVMLANNGLSAPYFDAALEAVLYWTGIFLPTTAGVFFGDDNVANSYDFQGWTAASANKANQDWRTLLDPTTIQVYPNRSGEGTLGVNQTVNSIFCNVVPPVPANIDRWWGTSTFAKYGIVAFNAPAPVMPAWFINLPTCNFITLETAPLGFYFALFNQVVCNFTTYSQITIPFVSIGGAEIKAPT